VALVFSKLLEEEFKRIEDDTLVFIETAVAHTGLALLPPDLKK
jgi:hypothetical protein